MLPISATSIDGRSWVSPRSTARDFRQRPYVSSISRLASARSSRTNARICPIGSSTGGALSGRRVSVAALPFANVGRQRHANSGSQIAAGRAAWCCGRLAWNRGRLWRYVAQSTAFI